MKHKNRLLQWAAAYHYPYLQLADGSHIAHGLADWRRASRNPKRALLAWQRVAQWEARLAEERERTA